MRRLRPLGAEVIDGRDEPRAKELEPVPVHGDAGGQRMLGSDEPACEREAIARTPW